MSVVLESPAVESSAPSLSTLDNRLRDAGAVMGGKILEVGRSSVAVWLDAGGTALELVGDAVCDVGPGKRFANAKEARQFVYTSLAKIINAGGNVDGAAAAHKDAKTVAAKLRDFSGVHVVADTIGRDRIEGLADSNKARTLSKLVSWDADKSIYSHIGDGRAQQIRVLIADKASLPRAEFRQAVELIADPNKAKRAEEVNKARQELEAIEKRDDVPADIKAKMAEAIRGQFPELDDLSSAKRKAKRAGEELAKLAGEYGLSAVKAIVAELLAALEAAKQAEAASQAEAKQAEAK